MLSKHFKGKLKIIIQKHSLKKILLKKHLGFNETALNHLTFIGKDISQFSFTAISCMLTPVTFSTIKQSPPKSKIWMRFKDKIWQPNLTVFYTI